MKLKKLPLVLVVVFFGVTAISALHFTVGFGGVIDAETTENDVHDGHDHESENSHAGEVEDADNAHEHDHDNVLGDEHKHETNAVSDAEHSHKAEAVADDEHDHSQDQTHGETDVIHIEKDAMAEYGIKTSVAESGQLRISLDTTGEVVIDPDRLSHIVPYISGVVTEVRKRLGDSVRKGETMAVIESRELSELQSSFLVARERLNLAETTYQREKRLWEKKISSETEYLDAKQSHVEAVIELEAADQKLHALGFDEAYLKELTFHHDKPLTRYEIAAPFEGIVIEKHISLGEAVKDDTGAFVIADLRSVWINLNVYQKDLPYVKTGNAVIITTDDNELTCEGIISWISPIMHKETRTATTRVEIPNRDSTWRPGLFVTGKITVGNINVPLMIPKSALQSLEGDTVVFVEEGDGFEAQAVSTGRADDTHVEILSGLHKGQRYVSQGGFELKSIIVTAGLGAHAGHGH